MSDLPKQPASGATVIADGTADGMPNPPSMAPVSPSAAPIAIGTPVPGAVGTPVPVGPTASTAMMMPHDLVGTVLAERYEVMSKLGEGGMGTVYLARHTTINKKLAIKVLSSEYSHKQDLVDRFLQEARAASMIEQQNVVEITDFGSTPFGSVFFVMEFLNGEDLSNTIKSNGALPWERVQPIMLQICDALAAAHNAGIIHRDMKPENCFRIKRGNNHDFIKVLDFGIAKVTTDEGDGGRNLTRTGMIFGTPEYMSPEQAKGDRVDARVDVYATGIIMYEMLTGRVPFTAETFMGILTKHMFEAPEAPSIVAPDANIPEQVEAIILKALQKDREYRFADMDEMADAMRAVGDGVASVAVMRENVALPSTGQIHFADGGGSTHAPGDDLEVPKNGRGLILAVGALAVAGAVAGALFAAGVIGGETAPVPLARAAEPKTEPAGPKANKVQTAEPKVEPKVAPPPVAPSEVSVTVSTPGIEGIVFDSRDDTQLGATNTVLKIPHSDKPVSIYIQAEGYEDFISEVVPDKNKKLAVELSALAPTVRGKGKKGRKSKGKKGRKGKGKGKGKGTAAAAAATVAKDPPKQDPPKKDPGWTQSGDLKNPFGR